MKEVLVLKKVLFIVNSLGQGGAERVVANLANEMCKNNEVTIITFYDDIAYELDTRIYYYKLNQKKGKLSKLKSLFSLSKQLNHLVLILEKDKKFDLITTHLPYAHLITRNTSFATRSFFIIHTVYSRELNRYFAKLLVKYIYKNKHVVTVSEGVKYEFETLFKVKCKMIKVIPNPIDIELIQNYAEEEFSIDFKYVLGVGRFEKNKRFDLMMKAFNLSNAKENRKLVILGDGTERETLKKLSMDLGIVEKVVFPGWVINPYVWLKNSDLVIITSEFEAFPMNILESLACDAKTISVDCDYGPREILKDELSPYLIKDQTIQNIGEKIDDALNKYPENRQKYALEYNIDNIIKKCFELELNV